MNILITLRSPVNNNSSIIPENLRIVLNIQGILQIYIFI